jgi:hypothetical protein
LWYSFPWRLAFNIDSGIGGSGFIGRNICSNVRLWNYPEYDSLFALVMAIGVVVDDAIVVIEAVHAKMEEKHLSLKSNRRSNA